MSAGANGMSKFPAFSPDYNPRPSADDQWRDDLALDHESSPRPTHVAQWAPRRNSYRISRWQTNGNAYHGVRHGRQKSLSEAIRTIRTRNGSISQNAMEIADALKAPVSPALVV
jgi:solute carrier family 35, member E1